MQGLGCRVEGVQFRVQGLVFFFFFFFFFLWDLFSVAQGLGFRAQDLGSRV